MRTPATLQSQEARLRRLARQQGLLLSKGWPADDGVGYRLLRRDTLSPVVVQGVSLEAIAAWLTTRRPPRRGRSEPGQRGTPKPEALPHP